MTIRFNQIRSFIETAGFSHLLITDSIDAEYISGFKSSNSTLLIGKRSARIFTDFRYHTAVDRFCSVNREWKYDILKQSLAGTLSKIVPPGSSIGFQSNSCTVDEYRNLRKKNRSVTFFPCGNELRTLLIPKTIREIRNIARAAAIGDQAFSMLLQVIRPGVTEQYLARLLERYCSELGSEKPSFDTIVLFGAHSAQPHGRPGLKKLVPGDFILIDFGCIVNGFASDMTRTFVFGKASEKQRRIYDVVKTAQKTACEGTIAGMPAQMVDALARNVINDAGFGKEFDHSLGHGVGLRIHELPKIGKRSLQTIPENAVITIEPGIYLPGFGGVRIEDCAVVKKRGIRLLTHTPKELLEL